MARSYAATRTRSDTGATTALAAVGDDSGNAIAARYAARVLTVSVDFGIADDTRAVTSVSGVPWVQNDCRPIAQVVGRPAPTRVGEADDSGYNDEDAFGVSALVLNIVDGVSFDVVAVAPDGANGIFTVQIIGVAR